MEILKGLNKDQADLLDMMATEHHARTGNPDTAYDNPNRYANYIEMWFTSDELGEITAESLATALDAEAEYMGGYSPYGMDEIEAIQSAVDFFNAGGDEQGLVPALESAIRAIRAHVLHEMHPMAVN